MIAILRLLFSKSNLLISNYNFRRTRIAPTAYHILVHPRLFCTDLKAVLFFTHPTISCTLVHEFKFHQDYAARAVSLLPESACPDRADEILSFLKYHIGCTTRQLQEIFTHKEAGLILGGQVSSVDDIDKKFRIFEDLGLERKEVANLFSNYSILHLSLKDTLLPRLQKLRDLLGSDPGVVRLLRKHPVVIVLDLYEKLSPNVDLLRSVGVPMDRIRAFLHSRPKFFTLYSGCHNREYIDHVVEMGVSPRSNAFIPTLMLLKYEGILLWNALKDKGFSKNDLVTMFKKAPCVFYPSSRIIESAVERLLATGKYDTSDIVACPSSLRISRKRLQVLQLLESRNLIREWPTLPTLCRMSRVVFEERFVIPYSDKVGEVGDLHTCMSY